MQRVANYVIMPNEIKEVFLNCLKSEGIDSTLVSTTGMFLREGQTTCIIVSDSDMTGDKISKLIQKAKCIFREIKDGEKSVQNVFFFQTPVMKYDVI